MIDSVKICALHSNYSTILFSPFATCTVPLFVHSLVLLSLSFSLRAEQESQYTRHTCTWYIASAMRTQNSTLLPHLRERERESRGAASKLPSDTCDHQQSSETMTCVQRPARQSMTRSRCRPLVLPSDACPPPPYTQ